MRRVALLALTLLPLAPGAGRAQSTPTPAQAQALEQQIRDWVSATLGPNIKLSKTLVTVKADGDHYRFTMPLGDGADAPQVTANGTPRPDGRWAMDSIRVPSPATFHIDLPGKVADQAAGMPSRLTYRMSMGQQSGEMMIDPSFASANTSTSTMQDIQLSTVDAPLDQTTHVDRATTSFVAQPATAGRLNVAIQSSMEGYKIDTAMPDAGKKLAVSMGRMNLVSSFDNVSRERFVQVVQALSQLGVMIPSPGAQAAKPTAEQEKVAKAAYAALLPMLTDLATGMAFDEKVENLSVSNTDMSGALRMLRVGFGTRAVDGLLQASLDLGAEGLTLPELGLGSKAELIPTRVSVRPVLSGVPTEVLTRILQSYSDGRSDPPEDVMALFARGGVTLGVDSLVIDVAGAELLAQGKVTGTTPADLGGTAQISITNLDLLQAKIASDPDLAQATPAIIFLKGVGRAEPNRMVWDVAYKGGRLTVNNQDMSMLTGAAAAPAQPDATVPSAPQASPRQGRIQEGHRELRRKP